MSGIAFPIPWYLVPLNVFYNYYGRHVAGKVPPTASKYIADAIGKPRRAMRDLVNASGPDAPTIFVNTLPELDFPWLPCPPNIVASGPIVSRVKSLSEADANLADWINRGPTIFVNLGTQAKVTEAKAIEIASALSICLDTLDDRHPERRPFQVLWKIKRTSKYDATSPDSRPHSILKDKIESGRVRITNWLVPEPLAILQTGKIACFVHHGGANSYNEAIL
jgi:UDP:flavonoid glycosyltransferase YjiC (YdhE family)